MKLTTVDRTFWDFKYVSFAPNQVLQKLKSGCYYDHPIETHLVALCGRMSDGEKKKVMEKNMELIVRPTHTTHSLWPYIICPRISLL